MTQRLRSSDADRYDYASSVMVPQNKTGLTEKGVPKIGRILRLECIVVIRPVHRNHTKIFPQGFLYDKTVNR